MRRNIGFSILTLMILAGCHAAGSSASKASPDNGQPVAAQMPKFTSDGKLSYPTGWDTWVMVGSSTGLSYNKPQKEPVAGAAPGMFHNIYMQPWAYRSAKQNGVFPEGTMFVMSFYEASRKSNPARAGFYEGDQVPGIEVHLKKAGVDSSGWGFYGFGEDTTETATRVPSNAACYTCHRTEAAFDNAFVQFYPALRPRLLAKADSVLAGAK